MSDISITLVTSQIVKGKRQRSETAHSRLEAALRSGDGKKFETTFQSPCNESFAPILHQVKGQKYC